MENIHKRMLGVGLIVAGIVLVYIGKYLSELGKGIFWGIISGISASGWESITLSVAALVLVVAVLFVMRRVIERLTALIIWWVILAVLVLTVGVLLGIVLIILGIILVVFAHKIGI